LSRITEEEVKNYLRRKEEEEERKLEKDIDVAKKHLEELEQKKSKKRKNMDSSSGASRSTEVDDPHRPFQQDEIRLYQVNPSSSSVAKAERYLLEKNPMYLLNSFTVRDRSDRVHTGVYYADPEHITAEKFEEYAKTSIEAHELMDAGPQ